MNKSACGEFEAADIRSHLERILSSDAFRTSPRSQEFMRFVVGRVLEGREDSIKERNIAIEVFDRSLAYNSSEDSFVRVKASEVRRRLAAYNAAAPEDDKIRIELPLGSYVPHFFRIQHTAPEASVEPPTVARKSRRGVRLTVAGLCLTAAAIAAFVYYRQHSALDDFWSPIIHSPETLTIFLPVPPSYIAIEEVRARRFAGTGMGGPNQAGERRFFVSAPHKVGLGAAQAAIRFATICTRTGKPYAIKAGEDFSFADLRNQPAILFGAFSSPWTLEMNNEHRFRLIARPENHILDSHNPSRQWLAKDGRYAGSPSEDYAIASRVIDSKSGRVVIIAAGISTFGTQAAAEFLTEPSRLEELARRAPAPLDRGNFQVLLHTRVIGNTPTPARIVDVHFW